MWPFKKKCDRTCCYTDHLTSCGTWKTTADILGDRLEVADKLVSAMQEANGVTWFPLSQTPPLNTNLLVANKDFTYFGFIYIEDGWDYSRQINMQGKDKIWATYTNADSVHWWLNLDEIKK